MKKLCWVVLFLSVGICSITAQDLIIRKNGNIIESKVTEISSSEIRYKRFDHLDGPTIVISASEILSIRYENGRLEVIDAVEDQKNDGVTTAVEQQPVYSNEIQQDDNRAKSAILAMSRVGFILGHSDPIIGGNFHFIGNSGFTVSFGLAGGSFSAGIGYVHYNKYYVGGLLLYDSGDFFYFYGGHDATPTFIAGYDFGNWLLGGQVSSGLYNGDFRFSLGVGVNVGASSYGKPKTPESPENKANKLIVGINANPAGFLLYGPSICLEFTKGRFYSEINLLFPIIGLYSESKSILGGLVTFNYFHPTKNGGFYAGGGIGGIYNRLSYEHRIVLPLGINAGYKFMTSSGLFFRTGGFIGLDVFMGEFYAKPEAAVGYSF